jgi:hypothetical protein
MCICPRYIYLYVLQKSLCDTLTIKFKIKIKNLKVLYRFLKCPIQQSKKINILNILFYLFAMTIKNTVEKQK